MHMITLMKSAPLALVLSTAAIAEQHGNSARYMEVCAPDKSEAEDVALCKCQADQLTTMMQPDEFTLFIELSEAASFGNGSEIAYLAELRGISEEEAESIAGIAPVLTQNAVAATMVCVGEIMGEGTAEMMQQMMDQMQNN